LRTAHRDEHVDLAELDAAAFPSGWALDAAAIGEAGEATPRARVRAALDAHGRAVGYAVAGRSGRAAFLQRLAVLPDAQGHGVGATLVDDVIRWAGRWRCRSVAVNTQSDNGSALRLYERAGFVARSHGLVVMERSLRSAP
jgi:ribosomal-protein-alanine N-acetyltransferase